MGRLVERGVLSNAWSDYSRTMADRVYQVGKRVGTSLLPAFKLMRRADGGIRLKDIDGVNDFEQSLVLAHFGRMLRSTTGVKTEQHRRLFRPGTQEHFDHAVHELPSPFALMRKPK